MDTKLGVRLAFTATQFVPNNHRRHNGEIEIIIYI